MEEKRRLTDSGPHIAVGGARGRGSDIYAIAVDGEGGGLDWMQEGRDGTAVTGGRICLEGMKGRYME